MYNCKIENGRGVASKARIVAGKGCGFLIRHSFIVAFVLHCRFTLKLQALKKKLGYCIRHYNIHNAYTCNTFPSPKYLEVYINVLILRIWQK